MSNKESEPPKPLHPSQVKFMGCRLWVETDDPTTVRAFNMALKQWFWERSAIVTNGSFEDGGVLG